MPKGPKGQKRSTKRHRGFKRLEIALGVPWFGFWLLVAWVGYSRANDPNATVQQQSDGNRQVMEAFGFGVFWPAVILIVAGITYWVYRGFTLED